MKIGWLGLVLGFLIGMTPVGAETWTSPNGQLIAEALPDHQTDERYVNWDKFTIRDRQHRKLAYLSLKEGSGINNALINDAVWSSDSRFFVFQTTSSGGHSVWHAPTYVYDAASSRIYSVDDTVGSITMGKAKLHFQSSDVIRLERYNSKFDKDTDPWSFPEVINLIDFVKTAKVAQDSVRYPVGRANHK